MTIGKIRSGNIFPSMIFGVFLLFFLRNRYVRLDEIILKLNCLFLLNSVYLDLKFCDEIIDVIKGAMLLHITDNCQICLFWKLVESNRHSFCSDI